VAVGSHGKAFTQSRLQSVTVQAVTTEPSANLRFASAVVACGMLARGLSGGVRGPGPGGGEPLQAATGQRGAMMAEAAVKALPAA